MSREEESCDNCVNMGNFCFGISSKHCDGYAPNATIAAPTAEDRPCPVAVDPEPIVEHPYGYSGATPPPAEDARGNAKELLDELIRTIRINGYRPQTLILLKETSRICTEIIAAHDARILDEAAERLEKAICDICEGSGIVCENIDYSDNAKNEPCGWKTRIKDALYGRS